MFAGRMVVPLALLGLVLAVGPSSRAGDTAVVRRPAGSVKIATQPARAALRKQLVRLSQILEATRTVKILVIGSSSTVGLGASSPSKTYVARLGPQLQSGLEGISFKVVGRGIPGEVAQGAADRMRREVEETKPDLVVWQVGTNDALGHVEMAAFRRCLKTTLVWLKEHNIDVVLINPQYGQVLVKDAYYEEVVGAVAEIAQEAGVLLVDRFTAMRKLAREKAQPPDLSADNLHMNDEGYRRLAEQLSGAIVSALSQAKTAATN